MRKVLVLLIAVVVSSALLSPAEAARSRSFSIAASVDNRKMDLDSSTGGNRTTLVKGRVKAGSSRLTGRKVRIYVTNVHTRAQVRRSLGTARLDRKGRFSKRFAPSEGGTYRVEIVKSAGNGRRTTTRTVTAHAYEWPLLDRFHDAAASNPDPSAPLVVRSDKEQTGNGRDATARWSLSYAISSGGSAVFGIAGYNCWRFNMKLAVSQSSRAASGTVTVSQGARVLARETLQRGGGYWEPSRGLSESLDPNLPVVVSVPPADVASGEPVARIVLGNPKASCTYPGRSTPYL
ncbi:hypothetical protein IFT73_18175 [Aeromicrobium sp. CFBP 8757]|uniref:hypothetical protein n=1 Tax=Aeromicrobium sp. CFBP 8757 TaxID=2775288 RepID=UPI0017804099|nr:hypothetical protein [Aeromicrobium sp. CFBP 8757]MBD8608787.1 hypothetical protein [Aeromicrobium sp. CFBP 8757]